MYIFSLNQDHVQLLAIQDAVGEATVQDFHRLAFAILTA